MANTTVIPAALKQQQLVAESVGAFLKVLPELKSPNQLNMLKALNENIESLLENIEKLKATLENAKNFESKHAHKLAKYMRDSVKPLISACREKCDALEALVDDELWALPKYSDMLFLK
jgi:glutamine synthetase